MLIALPPLHFGQEFAAFPLSPNPGPSSIPLQFKVVGLFGISLNSEGLVSEVLYLVNGLVFRQSLFGILISRRVDGRWHNHQLNAMNKVGKGKLEIVKSK